MNNSIYKTKTLICFAITLLFVQASFAQQSLFDRAHDAYADKKYKESIQLYS